MLGEGRNRKGNKRSEIQAARKILNGACRVKGFLLLYKIDVRTFAERQSERRRRKEKNNVLHILHFNM